MLTPIQYTHKHNPPFHTHLIPPLQVTFFSTFKTWLALTLSSIMVPSIQWSPYFLIIQEQIFKLHDNFLFPAWHIFMLFQTWDTVQQTSNFPFKAMQILWLCPDLSLFSEIFSVFPPHYCSKMKFVLRVSLDFQDGWKLYYLHEEKRHSDWHYCQESVALWQVYIWQYLHNANFCRRN